MIIFSLEIYLYIINYNNSDSISLLINIGYSK